MARIVFIGDDFTGASDTLATLAERGARTRLFLGAPQVEEIAGLDAIGIATDLRAQAPDAIVARLRALVPAIKASCAPFVHYKVCSTFDSSPHIGSIGAAVNALEEALAPSRTIILGGQPSLGRYCAFGTLFARAPDGNIYRIDRHPIMSRHPVTPMDEADLRIHLAKQGLEGLSLFGRAPASGEDGQYLLSGPARTLVDAIEQSDVENLGLQLSKFDDCDAPALLVGASSVAEALWPVSISGSRDFPGDITAWKPGPVLAIAGSRSSVTATQVAAAKNYERFPLKREDLADREQFVIRCGRALEAGVNVMIHLQPDTDYMRTPAELSRWLAQLTRSILSRHLAAGIAVAGGDTSSALVEELGFRSLSFVEREDAGVSICRGHAVGSPLDGAVLLLKGGQVGAADLFERFAGRFRNRLGTPLETPEGVR